ncbi:MAG: EAL domain-containing protein [Pseudolabrys sp.]|nr:EAL domain-containing protein [Pseudolabrys sp.]
MSRFGAIVVAICMLLIAASLGAVLFLVFQFDVRGAAIVSLAVFAGMILYNSVAGRLRDRARLGDQIADLSRGMTDLARQAGDMARRLSALEERMRATPDPSGADRLAAEIGELGGLVRQIAETVAAHEAILRKQGLMPPASPAPAKQADVPPPARPARSTPPDLPGLRGLSRDGVIDLIAEAINKERIDLYLQPIVTLPQRKVRYYEALARLRMESGEVIPAAEFLPYADQGGLMPKLDNLMLFRCVRVARRLQLKNRDVGIVCNVSGVSLANPAECRRLLDFLDANRALASALFLEFTQAAFRAFGPLENESLAALAERGFRFSMDQVADLRMTPRELADRGIRLLKIPASLLLDKTILAHSDIHPQDLADLLARSGIDVIADHIETESAVVDLLDYDVRFGQGLLFSGPRPVRAEALQVMTDDEAEGAPASAAGSSLRATAAR